MSVSLYILAVASSVFGVWCCVRAWRALVNPGCPRRWLWIASGAGSVAGASAASLGVCWFDSVQRQQTLPSILESVSIFGAIVLGIAALSGFIAGWRLDRSDGRRRCPRCWYLMDGLASLTCPECGRVSTAEGQLTRSRRSNRLMATAVVIAALSFVTFRTPMVHKWGWMGLMPTSVLVVVWPWMPGEMVTDLDSGLPARKLSQLDCRILYWRVKRVFETTRDIQIAAEAWQVAFELDRNGFAWPADLKHATLCQELSKEVCVARLGDPSAFARMRSVFGVSDVMSRVARLRGDRASELAALAESALRSGDESRVIRAMDVAPYLGDHEEGVTQAIEDLAGATVGEATMGGQKSGLLTARAAVTLAHMADHSPSAGRALTQVIERADDARLRDITRGLIWSRNGSVEACKDVMAARLQTADAELSADLVQVMLRGTSKPLDLAASITERIDRDDGSVFWKRAALGVCNALGLEGSLRLLHVMLASSSKQVVQMGAWTIPLLGQPELAEDDVLVAFKRWESDADVGPDLAGILRALEARKAKGPG